MTSKLFPNRSALLDSIRAVAVIMVVVFHVATRYPADALDPIARIFLRYGFLGVDVFFPLSGFLITRFLLSHDGPGAIRAFFLRRIFRIIPLYVIAVTTFYFAARMTGYEAENLPFIWATYTFLTGWFAFLNGPDSTPYTITWSLSVEEFAYLIFGLAAWAMRGSFRTFLVVVAILPFVLRLYLYAQGHENIYYFPLARLDSIAFGGLTAVLITRVRNLWVWLMLMSAVSVGLMQAGGVVGKATLFTTVTLVACTLIALAEGPLRSTRGRIWSGLANVGLYSYFIYLFHFFNLYALDMIFRKTGLGLPPFWMMSLLCMLTTYLQGWISFRYFEEPVMLFGRKLERSVSGRQPTAGEAR